MLSSTSHPLDRHLASTWHRLGTPSLAPQPQQPNPHLTPKDTKTPNPPQNTPSSRCIPTSTIKKMKVTISMCSPDIRIAIFSKSLVFWARWACPSTHTPVISLRSEYNALEKHFEMAMIFTESTRKKNETKPELRHRHLEMLLQSVVFRFERDDRSMC